MMRTTSTTAIAFAAFILLVHNLHATVLSASLESPTHGGYDSTSEMEVDLHGSATSSGPAAATTSTTNTDPTYPGTAVERMMNVRERVRNLGSEERGVEENDGTRKKNEFNGPWDDVRKKILWAGGLRDSRYTGHSFNDFNHVDLTCMLDRVSDNKNDGSVKGIAIGNHLGDHIRVASIPELGEGGSWSTCAMGCNRDPPSDVAHVQFRSRIAFKLVWIPNESFDAFVLVDDDGELLATGRPTGRLPSLRERQRNYKIAKGSKYSKEAERMAKTFQ